MSTEAALRGLQGKWFDSNGISIEVSDRTAEFSDQPASTFPITAADGTLVLRGLHLQEPPPEPPVWRSPSGEQHRWMRSNPIGMGNSQWAELFAQYKAARLRLRWQLKEAIESQDFARARLLREAWEEGTDFPLVAEPLVRDRLVLGRRCVSGVCFVHKKFKYRGVIVSCEPWCKAPTEWRAQMGVSKMSRGEHQPFYHCIVDERDWPGMKSTFVGEENIEVSDSVYPLHHPAVESLFISCSVLGGYLPSPELGKALQRHMDGGISLV